VKLTPQFVFHNIHLETDCLELIQIWEKRETQRYIIAPILAEIDDFRHASMEFAFTFASRPSNKVAHLLTKQVTDTLRSELWHVTPACVRDLIIFETPE
jgi:hypothetical protein